MHVQLEELQLGTPASHTVTVPESSARVWEVISDPQSLTRYHPFCERNNVIRWPGAESKDTIYYYSGVVLERHFTDWNDGNGFDLVARSDDGMVYKVSWQLEALDASASTLTITIWPTIQPGVRDRSRQLSRLLTRYLEQVGQGLLYYIRTGEPVVRNQFGAHRLFSPPV